VAKEYASRRTLLWTIGGVAFGVFLLLTVLLFPKLLRPDLTRQERVRLEQLGTDKLVAAENDRSNAQNNVRTTLLQGVAGVALLTGAYFAYRGLDASLRQLQATTEGQITSRYTEAVKQLGDDEHQDVRIGGIYALERIGRDSARDAPTVVALLASFVRRSCGLSHVVRFDKGEGSEKRDPVDLPPGLAQRAPDAQIALTVLTGLGVPGVNLHEVDLWGADLTGAYLVEADLNCADLGYAKLVGADLRGADLGGADLTGADLKNANLARTDVDTTGRRRRDAAYVGRPSTAVAVETNLFSATLIEADFGGANLTGANLIGADVTGADFVESVGVDFSHTEGIPDIMPDGSMGRPAEQLDDDEDTNAQ
jgi:Pentapeptide repeats (8 copies)